MPRLSTSPVFAHPAVVEPAQRFAALLAACRRLPAMQHSAAARRLDDLRSAGAWTDAALALLAIELPGWQLRRIAYDAGEWHCALSSQRDMPDWLDAAVETRAADMADAIMAAMDEVLRNRTRGHLTAVPAANAPSDGYEPMCCENNG